MEKEKDEEEEEESSSIYIHRRQVLRSADRERLVRYVRSIIAQNNTPLCDIIRNHALPHLPVQSLRRFLSVSRSWNSHLSTSPFFSHTQSHAHRSLSGFFYHLSYLPLHPFSSSIPDPSFSFIPDSVVISASSNGLVSCSSLLDSTRSYVCNPATREWTALPRAPKENSCEVRTAIVFNPSALNFSADYHVVRVSSGLHVFSSASGTWGTASKEVRTVQPREPWSSVAVDGVAYWPNKDGTVSRYDPEADELRIVEGPPQGEMERWELAEMGGRLCCVAGKEGMVGVWGLWGSVWREIVRVEMEGDPWPLVREGKEDLAVVYVNDQIVGINVRSGERRVLREGVTMESGMCVPYISSLVAVKEFCFGSGCFTCRDGCIFSS